jgi:hypothetical protein
MLTQFFLGSNDEPLSLIHQDFRSLIKDYLNFSTSLFGYIGQSNGWIGKLYERKSLSSLCLHYIKILPHFCCYSWPKVIIHIYKMIFFSKNEFVFKF